LEALRRAHDELEVRFDDHLKNRSIYDVLQGLQESVQSLEDGGNKIASEVGNVVYRLDCQEKDVKDLKDHVAVLGMDEEESGKGLERTVRSLVEDVATLFTQKHDDEGLLPEQFAELRDELNGKIEEMKEAAKANQDNTQELFEQLQHAVSEQFQAQETSSGRRTLDEDLEVVKRDLRCIKYEVKKLKSNVGKRFVLDTQEATSMVERSADVSPEVDPDVLVKLRDEITLAKLAAEEAKAAADEAVKTSNEAKATADAATRRKSKEDPMEIETLRNELHDLKSRVDETPWQRLEEDHRCLKYEVKKLKLAQQHGIVDDQKGHIDEIGSGLEFTAVRQLAEEAKDAAAEAKKGCDNANQLAEEVQGQVKEIEVIAAGARDLAEDAKSQAQEISSGQKTLDEDLEVVKRDLRCIKYEVKKLKSAPTIQDRGVDVDTQIDPARFSEFREEILAAKDRTTEASNEAKSLVEDMKSFAKEFGAVTQRAFDLAEEAKNAADEAKSLCQVANHSEVGSAILSELRDELTAVKAEAHAAKEATENSMGKEFSDAVARACDIAKAAKHETDAIKINLRCIKYEVKKLKSEVGKRFVLDTQEATSTVERSADVSPEVDPEVDPDVLVKLRGEITSAKLAAEEAQAVAGTAKALSENAEHTAAAAKKASDEISSVFDPSSVTRTLRCIKYELRRLKHQTKKPVISTVPEVLSPIERGVDISPITEDGIDASILSELREEIAAANAAAEEAKAAADEAVKTSNEAKAALGEAKGEFNHSLKRVVRDLNKVQRDLEQRIAFLSKELSHAKGVGDAVEAARKEADEAKQELGLLTSSGSEADARAESVEKAIRYLKSEVKKLKRRVKSDDSFKGAVAEVVPEEAKTVERGADISPATEDGINASVLSELREEIAAVKAAAEEAKAAASESLKESGEAKATAHNACRGSGEVMNAVPGREDIRHTLRCLKYEVKKLKSAPPREIVMNTVETITTEVREVQTIVEKPYLPEEFADQLEDLRNEVAKLIGLSSEPDGLEKIRPDIQCLKFEVRKLKKAEVERSESEAVLEQIRTTREELAEIRKAQAEVAAVPQEIMRSLQSLKRTVAKLKRASGETNK
jgi:DNA repair exonuclease SbcCD ATPase subunit